MKILAVDDEMPALNRVLTCLREVRPDAVVIGFSSATAAFQSFSEEPYDVAFLDIEMSGINGIDFARRIKVMNPDTNIIFVTSYPDYAGDAFELHASGYLMKPVTNEKVATELENLRHPVAPETEKHIFLRTFGNFEVFVNGVPVEFRYTKTKELLAWLTDRQGALCSNNELMAVLWEDDIKESYFRNIRADLLNTLPEDMFVRQWGKLGIRIDRVSCDYYDWIKGIPSAINAYNGEYMAQYSWGEWSMDNHRDYSDEE